MCKIVGREGTAKFGGDICIGLEDIARKREGGGLEIAPSGARVKIIGAGTGHWLTESIVITTLDQPNWFRFWSRG